MSGSSEKQLTLPIPPLPTTAGRAFVFVFPFGIERAASEIPPMLVRVGDLTCRLWPPHVNRADANFDEAVDYERIPSAPEARAATQSIIRLAVQRVIPDEADLVIATAMRVDVYGAGSTEAFRHAASATVDRFLRLCRLWLRQWWINRGHDGVFGTRRISFEVHPSGEPASLDSQDEAVIRPRLHSEAKLTNEHFQLVWAALSLGGDSPLSATALLDSFYFSAFGERERAILDTAIACEALLREEADHRLSELDARKAVPSQPLGIVEKVTRRIYGQPVAHSGMIAGLQRLQEVRNALAHGNASVIRNLPEISDPAALWEVQRSALELFRWAATVVPRTFPDPLLAFERP
ncbi:hypothetical protein [Longimicrobium sp.]|jgi:hypothetical protein|uniref:hypothetical protein n=1 Tax=Longimicrobium sp. TaxID=2029185 RepID=UPI002ED86864